MQTPRVLLAACTLLLPGCVLAQQAPQPPGTIVESAAPAAVAGRTPTAEAPTEAEEKIDAKDFDAARPLLDKYLAAHPNDARGLFDLGYLEDSQDHAEAAVAAYRKAIAADPKQFEAQLALGLLLARTGKPEDALPCIEAATGLDPAVPNPQAKARAWRALAQLQRTSNPEAASRALIEALKLTPETPDDTLLSAEVADAGGNFADAEAAYRRVLASQPDSSAATAGLAHLLLHGKKYEEAESLLRAALERDPEDPVLNSQLAATLNAEGRTGEAIDPLRKVHQSHPADATVTRMLAGLLADTGDYGQADALYKQLLAGSPGDTDLLTAHGQALLHLKDFPGAVAAFRGAVDARPDNVDALTGLALAASEANDPNTTLQALLTRSKYSEENPFTYFLRATAYDTLHQTKAAADFYHRFLAAAAGKFPDQEWQARHRLLALEK